MDAKSLIDTLLLVAHGRSKAFWMWLGATLFFLAYFIMLVSQVFISGKDLSRRAVLQGQRVTLSAASGEVLEGNPRHTRRGSEKSSASPHAGNPATPDSPIISKDGLAPAPLAAIAEQSDRGLIPVAAHDGTVAWKYYARPFTAAGKRPMVAVLITNLALSRPQTEDTLKLSHNFTLSFSPYAGDARVWAAKAREEGFESLVDLPLEPEDYPQSDPGPYGLVDTLDATEARARLHWVLSRFSGYVGTLGSESEKLTANLAAMRPPLTEMSARGVLFLYMKNAKNTQLLDLAKARTFLTVGVDMALDDDIERPAIDKQLNALVELAKKQGTAIGVAHSYPPTLEALTDWQQDLAAQGVDLVPVSAIALKDFP